MNEQFAVLQYANGISGEDSLLAWAGISFQTFDTYAEAFAECQRVNKIFNSGGLPPKAFVAKGKMHNQYGFILAKE